MKLARRIKLGVQRCLRYPALGLTAVLVIASTAWMSCSSVQHVVLAPPQIAGATFVGSDTCSQCHEDLTRNFVTATHARLTTRGTNAVNIGCESCHGPGSVHVESGGAAHTILNPSRDPSTCFQCHLDKRGQFQLPYAHPVLAGNRVSCADCHNPHRGPAVKGGGISLLAENETCTACHTAQRGPFVFEHEAMREGCTICHNPHGTVNAKMLTERNASLCLKCHFQQVSGGSTIGGMNHSSFLRNGTCWTAGCHEAVHGSQVSSTLRY